MLDLLLQWIKRFRRYSDMNQLFLTFSNQYPTKDCEQEAQLHCDILCQWGAEKIYRRDTKSDSRANRNMTR